MDLHTQAACMCACVCNIGTRVFECATTCVFIRAWVCASHGGRPIKKLPEERAFQLGNHGGTKRMVGPLCVTVPSWEVELEPFSSAQLEDSAPPPTPCLIRAVPRKEESGEHEHRSCGEKKSERGNKRGKDRKKWIRTVLEKLCKFDYRDNRVADNNMMGNMITLNPGSSIRLSSVGLWL